MHPIFGLCLYYAKDVDSYFIEFGYPDDNTDATEANPIYNITLVHINTFGARNPFSTSSEEVLDFVPARLEDSGNGLILTDAASIDESEDTDLTGMSYLQFIIDQGEFKRAPVRYDKIYVGYWDGTIPQPGLTPHPYVYDLEINYGWDGYVQHHYSLRLNDKSGMGSWRHQIDMTQKRKVSFLLDGTDIPNPRAVFNIRGKRYICEKITATFTENGMSQLLNGEFWPIKED